MVTLQLTHIFGTGSSALRNRIRKADEESFDTDVGCELQKPPSPQIRIVENSGQRRLVGGSTGLKNLQSGEDVHMIPGRGNEIFGTNSSSSVKIRPYFQVLSVTYVRFILCKPLPDRAFQATFSHVPVLPRKKSTATSK